MKQKVILLADDDRDDRDLFCEALAGIDNDLICQCAVNGSDFLKKLNELSDEPQLIFLDLNMPVMNGWDCLKVLKEDARYKHIPVVMISTSSHKREITTALELGALCYFVKPSNFKELTKVLQVITENPGAQLKDAILDLRSGGNEYVFV